MHIEQRLWREKGGWVVKGEPLSDIPQLVFVFGGKEQLEKPLHFASIREFYPSSHIILCSTAGEIFDTHVYDGSVSVTAVHFEKTDVHVVQTTIGHIEESERKGQELGEVLPHERLSHAMIFSDGIMINGTALVRGLTGALPSTVSVTGGLAGDGAHFKSTLVGYNEVPARNTIVCVGFYGDSLKIGYGSLGGWDPFGLDRVITRSKGNVLYELDCTPALELYKKYLGELAAQLPSSGLLFPMKVVSEIDGKTTEVVRTILSVNEEDQSLMFAGDMPEGATATLMKANFERLIDGATDAATMSRMSMTDDPELAILISCVGRKLVLKERVEDEVVAVRSVLGERAIITGFYSYGEICPQAATEKQCALHNQTMTITTFKEIM